VQHLTFDDGVGIAFETHGTGEPPLVLVHGYTGSSLDWTDVVDALAARRTVVTFDHRGHGESTNTGDERSYSFQRLTADLAALVDHLGFDRFDLLGHSMGGVVAMSYAVTHPQRLRSLILMDTSASRFPQARSFFEAGFATVRAGGMAALFATMAPFFEHLPRGDVIRERVRTKYEQMDPVAFLTLGQALVDYEGMVDEIAALDLPTSVIVGEHDIGLRPAAEELAKSIAGAALHVIAGAAHSPQEEQTQAWLDVVEQHLARAG
jgi:pimeloyl-ACP methyl ester carboxylesterase